MTDSAPPILFVCTGNVCRSPYLELRLRAQLAAADRHDLTLASAGSHALVGHPVSTPLRRRLERDGIDTADFRARQLVAEDVAAAGLVLTATRAHSRHVAGLDASAATRTFTVRQFLRLLRAADTAAAHDRSALLPALIAAANGARGRAGASTDLDDIEDPWGRSRLFNARVARTMDEVLAELGEHLVR